MTTPERDRWNRYDPGLMLSDPQPSIPAWTFLTNHAHVLVAISRDPELRQRDIAHVVGITPGAVTRILADLEANGCVTHERIGRRNRYHINPDAHLRHPLETDVTIGDLITLTGGHGPSVRETGSSTP